MTKINSTNLIEIQPKVSVIMGILATKEKLELVKRSITSIQTQTYNNLEIIINVDGSDEYIKNYCVHLSSADPRLIVLPEQGKVLLGEKLNSCLTFATGYYIARMDDDDYSYPQRIELQVEFLRENLDISFVGTWIQMVQGNQSFGQKIFPTKPKVSDFFLTQPFIHPTLSFRANVLQEVKGYNESNYCVLCEDYDLLLRLYNQGFIGANIAVVLLDYTMPSKTRKFRHRLNEVIVRSLRFREAGCLIKGSPFILKPLMTFFLPKKTLKKLRFRAKN